MCKGTGSFIYNKLSLVIFIIRLNSTQKKEKKVKTFIKVQKYSHWGRGPGAGTFLMEHMPKSTQRVGGCIS